ncbi:MAG TPA: RICIN domain-containing protein, partial [Luteolibacter sp.]
NVYWPKIAAAGNIEGPANKGDLNMEAGMAIALFCDDTAKFDHVLDLFRTYPGAGLPNTLATGEMGETGRDAGHGYGGLLGKAFIAECAWKQGIDLYSEGDNRLLAVGEYYSRNSMFTDNPFVEYGTVDALYTSNPNMVGYTGNRAAFYLLQNAYKNRKGLPTPWIDKNLQQQSVNLLNVLYPRAADFSTATPPAAAVRPPVSLASSGLTLTTLGNNSAGRSSSYANGVWTVTGAGLDVWGEGSDDCQFAYQQMTGDCAMVARVTSAQSITGSTKAGVMIRDTLSPTVSQRAYAAMMPTSPNQYQSRLVGATEIWAGRVLQTYTPPSGMPYWVKVERKGNVITTYSSPDGTSWSPTVSSYFGNLPSTTYIGLFVASGSATTTTTATFDHVAFTGGTGGLVTTPAAPIALWASGSNKAITVRWLPSFGATAYDVLRSSTSGSGYTVIASNLTADKSSYMDTTAAAGTAYYYVVRAKNSAGTSGNSPQFGDALLAAPMVNLAFGGTATDSAHITGQEGIYVFDGNPGSKWFNNNVAPTGWIQYDFGANNAQTVKRYTVSSANDVPARDPKDWTFLGSQDGATWTTLDSKSGQTFANRYQQNTYPIGNITAYRYYRLNITANSGDVGLQLSELGLWGDTGRTVPDGRYAFASRLSNKVIDLVGGGTADGTDATQWSWNGGGSQKWDLVYLGNGQYKLTGVPSGKLLEIAGASTNNGAPVQIWPSNNNNCQKWTVKPAGDGFFKLLNVNSGKSLDIQNNSTANGAAILQYNDIGASNQQWLMPVVP